MQRDCTVCSNPISEKRLAALPCTTLCLTCADSSGPQVCREAPINIRRLAFTSSNGEERTPGRKMRSISTSGLGHAVAVGF